MSEGKTASLNVTERREGGHCRLEAAGEIDLSNVSRFARALATAVADPAVKSLVLDLRQVVYMDSAGLRALNDARLTLTGRGERLGLALSKGSKPDRVIDMSGLTRYMDIVYDSDEPTDADQ